MKRIDPGLAVMLVMWAALLGSWAWIAFGGPLP